MSDGISPGIAQAFLHAAYEAHLKRQATERRCRRLLAKVHPTLRLRRLRAGYVVADRDTDMVPFAAPVNAEIKAVDAWLKAGAPLGRSPLADT